MGESRTVVLVATMRSPMTRLPAIKLTHGLTCAKEESMSAGDSAPIFMHAPRTRRGRMN